VRVETLCRTLAQPDHYIRGLQAEVRPEVSRLPDRTAQPLHFLVVACLFFLASACGENGQEPDAAGPLAGYDQAGHRAAGAPVPKRLPNLVIVLVDTLRRDAVAYPGESGGYAPYLSKLSKECVAFRNAASPSSWTVPSVASLLTGLHPHEHGCVTSGAVPRLPPAITTYAEALRNGYGYETRVHSGAQWFRENDHSLLQGFEGGSVGQGFGLRGTRAELADWARERDKRRPFLLVLHTFEAHDPYGPENHIYPDTPAAWRERGGTEKVDAFDVGSVREPHEMARTFLTDRHGREALSRAGGREFSLAVTNYTYEGYASDPRPELAAELRSAYQGGVRWVDGLIEDSVAALGEFGLLEDALLVVTSDHGEAFGEHGMLGHGRQLHDELIRVPLLMKGPGPFAKPMVVEGSASLLDVMPTFFDWAGLARIPGTHGASLLPVMRGDTEGHPVLSQEQLSHRNTAEDHRALLYGVRDHRWKLLLEYDIAQGAVRESLFDLRADPGALRDLVALGLSEEAIWDEVFCKAVETARGWAWGEVEDRRALDGTIYGSGDPLPSGVRPESCDHGDR
jgi:choline-sulfatase